MANGSMATDPNLLGVRDTLTNKYGISNERIGWDGEYVTIDNKRAIKPTQNVDGRTYADPSQIANAAQPYQGIPAAQQPATTTQPNVTQQLADIRSEMSTMYPQQTSAIDQQFSDILEQLSGRITNPSEIDMRDVYRSPMYDAQEAQIQRQAQQSTRAAQEALGSSGFGRSTRLMDRSQAIQNDANEYLTTQVVPAIMQQMQADQDRQTAALMDLLGVLGGERAFQDTREQNEFIRAMELLGYQTGREDVAYERNYQEGRDAIEDQRYADEFAYQQARDAIADERWKTEFDENVRQFGLDYALQQAVRQDRLSAEAADRALRARGLELEERSLEMREQEAASQANEPFQTERQGLVTAIRSGQLTPGQALQQIEEDLALGFYTPEQAEILRQDLQTITPNVPQPTPTTEQTQAEEEFRRTLPSDAELEAQARRLGYPLLDYRSYAKDPRGMMAGITFEQWRQLYGPRMG